MQPLHDLPVFRVADLAGGVRTLLERQWSDVIVEGELSNFKAYAQSGHCYFTLKDDEAQLRGVMWRTYAARVFFRPRDGMLVRARGTLSFYPARGEVQLVVREMTLAGEGALRQAFEAMKESLRAEGLFEAARKKPLPRYPERIGIVTSLQGAALQDMLTVLRRRFPAAEVVVCGVAVQGLGAADEIAAALRAFSALPADAPFRPDVLIVGRGGGSAEDLWAFNEEVVARAIHDCTLPVVSAVGHETDYTIADFVADVRAATPSMAAELVVPNAAEVHALLHGYVNALADGVEDRIRAHRLRLDGLLRSRGFAEPRRHASEGRQRLGLLTTRLGHAATLRLAHARAVFLETNAHLGALDPLRPLRLGYVRVEQGGVLVRSAQALQPGEAILHFADGTRSVEAATEVQ